MNNTLQFKLQFKPNLGCGICYEDIGNPTSAAPMHCCHCTHIVHHRCLLRWYATQRAQQQPASCPFCRHPHYTTKEFDAVYAMQAVDSLAHENRHEDTHADADAPILLQHTDTQATHSLTYYLHTTELTCISYIIMVMNIIFILILVTRVVVVVYV